MKETCDGLDKHSEEYLIFPAAPHYLDDPHLSTSILISPTGASYSEVTRNVPSNPHIAAYQEVAFSGQQKELRLTYKRPEGELNQVIIPYNGKAKLPSGNPIGIMTIGMLQERDAQQQAFNAVVNSFLYR